MALWTGIRTDIEADFWAKSVSVLFQPSNNRSILHLAGMAPDVLRGLCPRPCDKCKRRKIRKAMALISRKYPLEWNEITRQYGR